MPGGVIRAGCRNDRDDRFADGGVSVTVSCVFVCCVCGTMGHGTCV